MRDFAEALYSSKAWKNTRDAYKRYRGGLCEECYRNGIVKAGEIVHHKIHLNADNVNDPGIALSFDNLELLCRDCHGKQHQKVIRRYKIDELGRVISI